MGLVNHTIEVFLKFQLSWLIHLIFLLIIVKLKKIGTWGPDLIWQMENKYKMSNKIDLTYMCDMRHAKVLSVAAVTLCFWRCKQQLYK